MWQNVNLTVGFRSAISDRTGETIVSNGDTTHGGSDAKGHVDGNEANSEDMGGTRPAVWD